MTLRSVLAAVVLATSSGWGLVAATAGAGVNTGASSGPTVSLSPSLDLANLDIVSHLNARGKCLFNSGVFPAGGVGYKDSSLTYDAYPPLDAALATYRAELLRAYPDRLGGVIAERAVDGGAIVEVSFERGLSLTLAQTLLQHLRHNSAQFAAASRSLLASAVEPLVKVNAETDFMTACLAQSVVTSPDFLKRSNLPDMSMISSRDESTGQLRVEVPVIYESQVRRALSQFADAVVIVPMAGIVEFQ